MDRNTVLCVADEEVSLASHEGLESFGFSVLTARVGPDAITTFTSHPVDAVILDCAKPDVDCESVSSIFKQVKPRIPVVLVSAAPPRSETTSKAVDAFVAKETDPALLVKTLESFIRLRSHSHSELQQRYVVYADVSRRFLDCTDDVCQLLGLNRMELVGMTIEDISYVPEDVSGLFANYVKRGQQDGEYVLKHKNGLPILMRYNAYVFPDGCMAAVWEPLLDWRQLYSAALVELDPDKLRERVDAAHSAIQSRISELTDQDKPATEELRALEDALVGLKILIRESSS